MKYHIHTGPTKDFEWPLIWQWRIIALLFFLLSMFELALVWNLSYGRVSPRTLVYQVCNESRISPNMTEQACGELQHQLGIEFLCDQANDLASTHCWTEDNPKLMEDY